MTNFAHYQWPSKKDNIRVCQAGKGEEATVYIEGMRNDSESGDDLVFLSPPDGETPPSNQDTGASPRLRRSSRKRKSTAEPAMSKESGSKKKRNSTGNKKGPEMPKTVRTPPKDSGSQAASIEALLAGMEARLASKIDATNNKVDRALNLVAEANTALDDLEMRVIATEKKLEGKLEEVESRLESRLEGKMNTQVKTLVLDQLKEAGFDPDLSAGALSTVVLSKKGTRPRARMRRP